MSDEHEHVSIARTEAKYFFNGRKLLGKDINRLERLCYVKGRTAKPCEEQIEAATRERSKHQIVFSIDGIRKCCSCGAVVGGAWGDDHVAFERHMTTMMLEAARKAVM